MNNTSYGTSSNSVCLFDGSFRNTNLSISKVVVFTSFVADGLLPVALIGNALVLETICKNTSLRTTSYIVLGGLALAHILGAMLSQPSYIAWAVFCFAKHGKKNNYLPLQTHSMKS